MSERAPLCMMCLVGQVAASAAGAVEINAVNAAQGVCATTLALVAQYGIAPVRAALCAEHGHRARVDDLVVKTAAFDPRARA